VSELFPGAAEAGTLHADFASFLSAAPGGGAGLTDQALLEEIIHHTVLAGDVDEAARLYWHRLGATSTLCEAGDLAFGERVVREILDGMGRRGSRWRPRLLNEVA